MEAGRDISVEAIEAGRESYLFLAGKLSERSGVSI